MLRKIFLNSTIILFLYWLIKNILELITKDSAHYQKVYQEFFKDSSLVINNKNKVRAYLLIYMKVVELYNTSLNALKEPSPEAFKDAMEACKESKTLCLDYSKYMSKNVGKMSLKIINQISARIKIYQNHKGALPTIQMKHVQQLLEKMAIEIYELKDIMKHELLMRRETIVKREVKNQIS